MSCTPAVMTGTVDPAARNATTWNAGPFGLVRAGPAGADMAASCWNDGTMTTPSAPFFAA